jgi:hypothetical protein
VYQLMPLQMRGLENGQHGAHGKLYRRCPGLYVRDCHNVGSVGLLL